jgi:hypothetical protein
MREETMTITKENNIEEQGLLFPELDPYKVKIKDVDFVDVSTIHDDEFQRKTTYTDLPPGKFFIFKSGGLNIYRPEMGDCFPYVHNKKTGHIYNPKAGESWDYPAFSLNHKNINVYCPIHRLVGLAFLVNPNPKQFTIVDHINGDRYDWSLKNLRWNTRSGNGKNRKTNNGTNQFALFRSNFNKNDES